MAKRGYARRYSQAIFQIALERDELDKWQADLAKIASLSEDAALAVFLDSPRLNFNEKTKLLSERLGDINPLAMNLVHLLLIRGKWNMAGEIASEYQRLADRHRGIEQAEVTTAAPLDDADKLKLEERLGIIVDKKVVVKSKVDSSLIGGIIARVGGKLLDGSTRSRLEALKREISRARG